MKKLNTLSWVCSMLMASSAVAAPSFINHLTVPGDAQDLSGQSGLDSRLSFGSELVYDKTSNTFFGLADRGPGGGVLPYDTRVQQFSVDVNSTTGMISQFQLRSTVKLSDANGTPFNGLNPQLLSGNSNNLGNSFDPEGLVRLANGNLIIADEYGPSIKEFDSAGRLLRNFTIPQNLVPSTATGPDFVSGRGTIITGRQDNRGFEGLTLSADGKTLYAVLQAPLVNEGASNDGRRSANVRIVEFNVSTGTSNRQVIYSLDTLADINNRIPGTSADFTATQQGRSIGISAIRALPDGRLLVLERDNRGLGVEDITAALPVGLKRVYIVDPRNATNVAQISLAGSNSLPPGVIAVTKELYLDLAAALQAAGVTIAEKIEGMELGPQLADGSWLLMFVSDNDFSITQTGSGVQSNVCYDPSLTTLGVTTAIGTACAAGTSVIPSYIYAFAAPDNLFASVPLPSSIALIALGGIFGLRMQRRHSKA